MSPPSWIWMSERLLRIITWNSAEDVLYTLCTFKRKSNCYLIFIYLLIYFIVRSLLSQCLSPPRCINGYRQILMLGSSIPSKEGVGGGGVEAFLVASCCRNRDKLRPGVPLGSYADLTLHQDNLIKPIFWLVFIFSIYKWWSLSYFSSVVVFGDQLLLLFSIYMLYSVL